jgi:hypothetical protein
MSFSGLLKPKKALHSISSRLSSAIGIPEIPSTALEVRQFISEKHSALENEIRGSPCLNVDVVHHHMKSHGAAIPNVMKCVDMSLVHINVRIG